MASQPRSGSLVFPIVLITLGVLFLIARWQPGFHPWQVLSTYWPLILILIGIGKIWDNIRMRQNPQATSWFPTGLAVAAVVLILLLVGLSHHGRGFRFAHHRNAGPFSGHVVNATDLQGAESVSAAINIGAGQLNLSGGSERLLDATFDFSDSLNPPTVDYRVSSSRGDLTISQESNGPSFGHNRNEWTLHFNSDVPLAVRAEMGAGQGNLNFRNVNLSRLDLHIGAGQLNVDLTGPRKKDVQAEIQGGVGEAVIRLPRDVGVAVRAHGGIGSIDTHGLAQNGDEYTNAAYGKSPATIHLRVEGGIGRIELWQE